MNPSDGFWEGVGAGIGQSPWWALLGALLIGGILFATVKYIVPANKEVRLRREDNNQKIRMRELDIREREAQNDADRIKANAALAENMRGLRESNDQLAQQSAMLVAGIEESKARSRGMGDKIDHIDRTASHTDTLVEDIHRHIIGGEGTD